MSTPDASSSASNKEALMFVVFGASGNTGSVVASTLLDQGKKVRVVARDASKVSALENAGAEVFIGDVLDAASVAKALEGADEGVYFLVPPDPKSTGFIARGKKLADNYAAALAKANVKHGVYLSSVGAQLPSGTGPIVTAHNTEEILKTKTPFTFLRAAYFMENVLNYAHPIKADGVLPVFGGGESYPFPMVATRDIGRVAAEALLAPVAQSRVIELSGPEEYSLADAASEASKIVGKPVKATPLPIDALVPGLVSLGFSEDVAKLYREMTEAFGSGKVGFEGTPVRGKVGLGEVLRAGLS
jgi:uncharacterized protein YbjT (DUF2867 family)